MRNAACLLVLLIVLAAAEPARAETGNCEAQSQKGDVCVCQIAALHPTQSSVGMVEVEIKAEKLKAKFDKDSEADFLSYLKKHEKEEPVVIGPGGVFYITDHHHLARALYDIGVSQTICMIADNLSDEKPDAFWKRLEANNEVYLKDQNGSPLTPEELPGSIKDLADNPFRSLAGAVRQSCGFEKGDLDSPGEDYLEFQWAEFLRERWPGTGIAAGDIDKNFDAAANAALQLAAEKDAKNLPGYTGKTSCD